MLGRSHRVRGEPVTLDVACRLDLPLAIARIARFEAHAMLKVAGGDGGMRVAQIREGHIRECET